jgi:molecular chaperone GrpE
VRNLRGLIQVNTEQQKQEEVQARATEAETAQAGPEGSGAGTQDWAAEARRLQEEVDNLKEQSLRVAAEMQNIRRRAEMDIEKAHKYGLEKFAKELLPVIDSLEKAIEAEVAADNEMTPLREGVEMTLSMFLNGIRKFELEQIDPVGQPFNPELHEAMSLIEAPGAAPNSVVAAMQKGYTLHGRLLRPAMVMIAKS